MIVSRRPEIDRFLNTPPPAVRAALIYGRDQAIVQERASALAARVTERPDDPFDVAWVGEAELETGRLEEELMGLSMIGGRRLVRLRLTIEKLAWDRAAAEALDAHLSDRFNPEAFLLIEAAALAKDSPVRRKAEAAPNCVALPCYEDETGDLARLTREALSADGVGLTTEALDLFVSRLPRERGLVRREIERLVLFLGPGRGGAATAQDLDAFHGVEPETSLSEVANDAFGGRFGRAYAGLRRAALEGEGGSSTVRALSAHLGRLRRIITLHESGLGLQAAMKALRVFWKDEKELMRQARTWAMADLDALQPEMLTADQACKQSGSADILIAEHLCLAVAGRARRLGL